MTKNQNQNTIKHPPNGHSIQNLAMRAYVVHHETTIGSLPPDMRYTPLGWDALSLPEQAAWESVVMDLLQLVSRPAERGGSCIA